jgi:hypothetical protein
MYSVGWSFAAADRGNLTWAPRVNGTLARYLRGSKAITKLGPSFLANSMFSHPPSTNDGGERRLGGMLCSGLGSPGILRAPFPLCRYTYSAIGATDIPHLSVSSTTGERGISSHWKSCSECRCVHPPALVSTTLHLWIPCMANPVTPCRHNNPVLEMVHLAQSLFCPSSPSMPEAPLPTVVVLRRIGTRHVGLGSSPTPSDPSRQNLQPKGPPSSLPGSWSAVTTKEAGTTKQLSLLSPGLKALTPCSRFRRGGVMYAPDLLGCTNYGSFKSTWSWGAYFYFYMLH